MLTTGDPIPADEAYRIGLVNRVVPDEKLWDEVEAFTGRLVAKGPVALDLCKRAAYRGGEMPLRDGLEYERDRFCEILLTEDAQEGTKAFLGKRKPQFKGK
jgi:enoyl-CoA hydratase/carnithine racemase